jgi:hypothetical protein
MQEQANKLSLKLVSRIVVSMNSSCRIVGILFSVCCSLHGLHSITANGLPLAAVGDFGALHCQPSTNVDKSTALDLTTSAPIAASGCWRYVLFLSSILNI